MIASLGTQSPAKTLFYILSEKAQIIQKGVYLISIMVQTIDIILIMTPEDSGSHINICWRQSAPNGYLICLCILADDTKYEKEYSVGENCRSMYRFREMVLTVGNSVAVGQRWSNMWGGPGSFVENV